MGRKQNTISITPATEISTKKKYPHIQQMYNIYLQAEQLLRANIINLLNDAKVMKKASQSQ
jgi:hypothetical protein